MKTRYLSVNPENPEPTKIAMAAEAIKSGELVAFPTETVYGLGADALNGEAVKKIFQAKGRPRKNPLIVHVAGLEQAQSLTSSWPENARRLAARFWPGPLTLVLPKSPVVPEEVSAGLPNVGLRFPDNKVAIALIRSSGVPLAAPSANLSGRPSPLTAAHVWQDLQGRVAVILDGGPAGMGVESTILDLSRKPPVLLRPGGISQKQIENLIGGLEENGVPFYPGAGLQHYQTRSEVVILAGEPEEQVEKVKEYLLENHSRKVGVLATLETEAFYLEIKDYLAFFEILGSRQNLSGIAQSFFSALRESEEHNLDVLLVESVPPEGIGLAVMNRLRQAAQGRFI